MKTTQMGRTKLLVLLLVICRGMSSCTSTAETKSSPVISDNRTDFPVYSVADSTALRLWSQAHLFLQKPGKESDKRALGILMSIETLPHTQPDFNITMGIVFDRLGMHDKAVKRYKKEIALGDSLLPISPYRFGRFRESISYSYLLLDDTLGFELFERKMHADHYWQHREFIKLTKSEIAAVYTGSFQISPY